MLYVQTVRAGKQMGRSAEIGALSSVFKKSASKLNLTPPKKKLPRCKTVVI